MNWAYVSSHIVKCGVSGIAMWSSALTEIPAFNNQILNLYKVFFDQDNVDVNVCVRWKLGIL